MRTPTRSNPYGSDVGILSKVLRPFFFVVNAATSAVFPVFFAAYRLAMFVLYLPLNVILKLPFVARLINRFSHDEDAVAHMAKESEKLASHPELGAGEALLMRGNRFEFANLVAPKAKHPSLYRLAPLDLERSIVSDGRLVNGDAPASALAGLAMTPGFVVNAWKSSTRIAIRICYLLLVMGLVFSCIASVMSGVAVNIALSKSDGFQVQQRDLSTIELARDYADVWSPKDRADLLDKINVVDKSPERAAQTKAKVAGVSQGFILFVLLIVATLLFSVAAARIVWIGRIRFLVHAAADTSVAGLRHSWREALQRWRWRLPEREMELENYNDQVNFATVIDKSPLIDIGVSLGVMEHRGHLLAPTQGQTVRMSVVDMLQHTEVLGGSGEGKSRNFYIPLVRQLMFLRKQGYPIAIYATDDKGAIGVDILEAARSVGLPESDILVIGTGPNDYRVDLLAGLEPVELADMIRSVAKQAGGDSSDDFWPEMASDLLLQVATVCFAAEYTRAGELWCAKNNMRMYSLLNILRVASSDEEIDSVLRIVCNALQDKNDQYRTLSHLDKNSLEASVAYLSGSWLSMVDATKDGIRANARKALRSFAFKDEIAQGFADGVGDRLISASEISSNKIKIINVSQVEHGSAARMVSIMLKTLLFKQARQAELKDPVFAKERLNWWFNPVPGTDTDKYAINVFLADEYQALATSGGSGGGGLDDSSVWNVLRSAGVAGVLLSQSVSAYRMAVGDKATDNMRRNWRTKIILRTEDLPTIEEAKKLAGKTMRFQSMDWNHMESSVAVRRETGAGADSLPVVEWDEKMNDIPLFFTPGLYSDFAFAGFEQAYGVDQRFIPTITVQGMGPLDINNAHQAAAWRQEDRTAGILQHGSSESEAVHDEDIMTMGRARALVFVQRAGGTRVDFVKLNG